MKRIQLYLSDEHYNSLKQIVEEKETDINGFIKTLIEIELLVRAHKLQRRVEN